MGNQMAELINSVDQIKRLLILQLRKNGSSQAEIAKALGVNQSSISRLFAVASDRKSKQSK